MGTTATATATLKRQFFLAYHQSSEFMGAMRPQHKISQSSLVSVLPMWINELKEESQNP